MNAGCFRVVLLAPLLLACCGGSKTPPAAESSAPVLKALHPEVAVAGSPFNAQPDGASALAVTCERATTSTVIVFGEERLKTVFGSDKLLTALVPAQLTARTGTIPVRLENEAGKSNVLNFLLR